MNKNRTDPRKDGRVFVLICVLLGGTGQGIVSPKLPQLIHGTESLTLISGLSGTLFYLGIFISTFFYGRMADRGKFHLLMTWGLLCYVVSLVGLAFSRSPASLLLVRLFEGLALSALFTAADFALGRLSPILERARWLSFYGIALSLGLMLGPLLCLASSRAPRYFPISPGFAAEILLPFGLVSGAALILAAVAPRFRIAAVRGALAKPASPNRGALAVGAAYGGMEAAIVAVFPILAMGTLNVLPEYCLLTMIGFAGTTSFFWGWAADYFGPKRIAHVLLTILVLGPLTLFSATFLAAPTFIAYSSSALFGLLAGGLYPVGFAWLLESYQELEYGFASGSFTRAYSLGSLIGPTLAGVAAQYLGTRGFLGSLSSIGLISSISVYYFARRKQPEAFGETEIQPTAKSA